MYRRCTTLANEQAFVTMFASHALFFYINSIVWINYSPGAPTAAIIITSTAALKELQDGSIGTKAQLVPLGQTARTVHRDLKANKVRPAIMEAMAAMGPEGSEDFKVLMVQLVPLVLVVQTAPTAPTARTVHRDLKANKVRPAMMEAMAATELEGFKVRMVPLVLMVQTAVTVPMARTVHKESMVATV